MSVYEGIMKGLEEALEHAEGKTELREDKRSVSVTVKRMYAPVSRRKGQRRRVRLENVRRGVR